MTHLVQKWHISADDRQQLRASPGRLGITTIYAGDRHGAERLLATLVDRESSQPPDSRATAFNMVEVSHLIWDSMEEQLATERAALAAVAHLVVPGGLDWWVQCPTPDETIYSIASGRVMMGRPPTQDDIDDAFANPILIHLDVRAH